MKHFQFFALFALVLSPLCHAASDPARHEWKVDGVTREALVYAPDKAKTDPAPLLFVFHGHGGTMDQTVKRFQMHRLWPEAIVVCPQGLNTAGRLVDKEGKSPGWQVAPGQEGDRDLKFFDAMLASLKTDYKVDDKRIYCTGHSNGGALTYLLWAVRGDVFAAVAPTAAVIVPEINGKLKPKPALHLAGETDPLVKYEWQVASIMAIKELNQCGEGQPWGEFCTMFPSKIGAPVVTYIHPGQHGFPKGAEAVIVKFLKEQVKK